MLNTVSGMYSSTRLRYSSSAWQQPMCEPHTPCPRMHAAPCKTSRYLLATCVEAVLQLADVAVGELLHHVQLAILARVRHDTVQNGHPRLPGTHLEPLVLQNLLDSHDLAGFGDRSLKHDAERAIADDSVR